MYLLLFRAIFLSITISPISGSLFKFVANLTISDTKNPPPFWNCAKNKPVQNAAVYMGSDIVDETDFLDDSEIIFGDGLQVRPYVSWNEPRKCSKQDLTSSITYSWHDPANWVNVEDNDMISNFVHAQKVPGNTDTAAFPTDSSYLVVINLPIRVGLIQANDFNHSTKSFLQHMRSFEGGLQFRFGPSITAEYVWSDLNLITDALTITSHGCNDNRGCLNSNFDKKTMSEICSHVSCPKVLMCEKPVKPVGHCCDVCVGDGGIVKESIKIIGFSENVEHSAATIIICILIILIVGIFIGYWKRENIQNLFIRERVNLTAFWGSNKASEPHRDDRMLLEFSRETGAAASSSTLSSVSSSNRKSLIIPKMELSVPKKFKVFFESKKRRISSTSGEASLEMRYPKKQLSITDTTREMSSATTFTNPMFDKNYSSEFDE